MTNKLIQEIFNNFSVDGASIPVKFLYYHGHGEPFITYQLTDEDNSYSGDDDMLGYVEYYDFDVYSKRDYTHIIENVKKLLKDNGFTYQPMRSSGDMYEKETGYYHRTLCFAILKED